MILRSCIYLLIRKKDDRSADYVNTTPQQQLSMYEGFGQISDAHIYEQMARTEHV